jgi:hypothetical protein
MASLPLGALDSERIATLYCGTASPKGDGRANGISERKFDNEGHG